MDLRSNELGLSVEIPLGCSDADRILWLYPMTSMLYRAAIFGLVSEGKVFEYMNIQDEKLRGEIAEVNNAFYERKNKLIFDQSCLYACTSIILVWYLFDERNIALRSYDIDGDVHSFQVVRTGNDYLQSKAFNCPAGLIGTDIEDEFSSGKVKSLLVSFDGNGNIILRATSRLTMTVGENVFDEMIFIAVLRSIDPNAMARAIRIEEALEQYPSQGRGLGR